MTLFTYIHVVVFVNLVWRNPSELFIMKHKTDVASRVWCAGTQLLFLGTSRAPSEAALRDWQRHHPCVDEILDEQSRSLPSNRGASACVGT